MATREESAGWQLSAPVGRIAARFAEVVCPPEVRTQGRADRVVGEFELMLASVQPAARHALSAALIVFDRAAWVSPRARGRRFVRLGDQAADRYVRTLLARSGGLSSVVRRLKGLIVGSQYGTGFRKTMGRTGFEPVTYSVSGNSRAAPYVCHRRTESKGEASTCVYILTGSR
jgi:hypothetical protein